MTEDECNKRVALPEGDLLNLMMYKPPVPAPTKKTTMSFQEMYTSKSKASRTKPAKQELLPEERGYISYAHELDFRCFDSDEEDKKPSAQSKHRKSSSWAYETYPRSSGNNSCFGGVSRDAFGLEEYISWKDIVVFFVGAGT